MAREPNTEWQKNVNLLGKQHHFVALASPTAVLERDMSRSSLA